MFIVFIKPYAQPVSAQIGILHYKYTKKNEIYPQGGEYSNKKLEVRSWRLDFFWKIFLEVFLEVKELRS